jgi:hypothetical protein
MALATAISHMQLALGHLKAVLPLGQKWMENASWGLKQLIFFHGIEIS